MPLQEQREMANSTGTDAKDKFLLRWTLAKKVGALAAVFLVLLVTITGYLYWAIGQISFEVAELAHTELPSLTMINRIEQQQLQQQVALERALRLSAGRGDTARRDRAISEFENHERLAAETIETSLQSASRAGRTNQEYSGFAEQLRTLQKSQRESTDNSRKLLGAASAGRFEEVDRLAPDVERTADDISRQIEKLVHDIDTFATESAANAEAHEVRAANVAGALGLSGGALGIIVSLVFVGGLRKTVAGLTGNAVKISEGNLQQEKLPVATTDELGQLSLIFNDMLDNLRENVSQSRAGAEALSAAVAEILASTKEQAAATTEQAAAVQETTATMEEISQSGQQVSDRARQVAAAAESTATATNVGIEAVQAANKVMNSIQEQSEAVAENIVALSEKNQAVGEIIATVNDIAEQSNLLALNAAIEAAAAGEHGRSFSVVASEIKNLANQAKEATAQVRTILGGIQKGINTSVMLTEEVVKRVESGKKQSDIAERTIHHMAQSLNESIQAFQQITAATNQQQIGFEQVTQALKNIRQASDQTAISTGQLEKAAINLNSLGQQLTKTVERYRL
jgi:methyl-accepting chemotaxis protein